MLPQRQTERTHHQIESALHARVQGLHALVQEIEQTVDYLPQDVQGALLTPLADLHSQLCGLVYPYPFWLKASRLKLAAKAVELGGSRLLLKEKKFSRVVTRS